MLPNFLVAGVPKAGTTLLHDYLLNHPEIFVTKRKEPRFFSYWGKEIKSNDPVNKKVVTTLNEYKQLFTNANGYKAIGECSGYFSDPFAVNNIYKTIPDVKIILLLRDPIERAYSHFLFSVQKHFEPRNISFSEAIRNPSVVLQNGWIRNRGYVETGFYGTHYMRLCKFFDASRIKIFLFEDFINNPGIILNEIADYLEVLHFRNLIIDNEKAKSGIPKSNKFHNLLLNLKISKAWLPEGSLRRALKNIKEKVYNKNLYKPELKKEDIIYLKKIYDPEVELLKASSKIEISSWTNF